MKIKYLGTGAAEGWPAVFCQCEHCRRARRLGGKNIRHRACSLINGDLLIDFSADTFGQVLNYGLDLSSVKNMLITHNHEDHFYAHELTNIADPFGHNLDGIPARLYGSATVTGNAMNAVAESELDGRLEFVEVKAFQPFVAGEYTVTPLPANHGAGISFIYLIESHGKTMLYAHDTGWLLDSVWQYLGGRRLDYVSMDGTCLDNAHYDSHMTLDENIAMKQRLISMGSADTHTMFVSNHFSHNGGLLHDEIVARLEPRGILTAYDGMEVEF